MMNFDSHWKGKPNMAEDTFAGRKAFSEAESKILRDYVLKLKEPLHIAVLLYSPLSKTNVSTSLKEFVIFIIGRYVIDIFNFIPLGIYRI